MTPDRLLNNLEKINLAEIAIEAVSLHEKEIIELQQLQMSRGLKGDRSKTKTYKSKPYVDRFKAGTSSLPHRDYFLTGDFYKEFFVKTETEKAYFGSMNEKTNKLESEENGELFGLSGTFKEKEIEIIRPDFIKILRNAINR